MKNIFLVLPALLLLTPVSSTAMSLGRQSGVTLIGRPLDISVQVVLEAQDDAGNLCLDADVFYADTKLDRSRVRVTLEKSLTAPTQALIRIRSFVLVDEPVVTLYLRAGCQLKTERRYVALAELVPETAPDKNTLIPMPPLASIKPAVAPPPLDAVASTFQATNPKTANPANAVKSVKGSRSGAAAASKQASSENSTPEVVGSNTKSRPSPPIAENARATLRGGARLRLEPLDLSIERDPQLKASAELLSIPATDPQSRAAASALWRFLSAQPQDILRDTEKLRALENTLRVLQTQNDKNLSSIGDLNVKLQKAQSERYANIFVYALVALLMAALMGLAVLLQPRFFGRRSASGDRPWWRKNEAYENQQAAWSNSAPSREPDEMDIGGSRSAPKPALVEADLDFTIDQVGGNSGGNQTAKMAGFADSSRSDKSGFGSSILHSSRAVKAEELFDVQQQADFFVSIGQHDQAIEVLRSHIAENFETSALVYLDLFNLYHQLKQSVEYDSLRVTFNQRFNTQVPTFDLYTDKYAGLESYKLALSRIEALWPTPKVLEIIEESLFRQPDSKAEAFNLEAYRELLLLYSVAKDIIGSEPSAAIAATKFDLPDRPADSAQSQPARFMSTSIQPLSASMDAASKTDQAVSAESLAALVVPPPSLRLGLDIDLSRLSNPGDKADVETASDAQFFAQFDMGAPAAAPALDSSSMSSAAKATNLENLIDFEAFLVSPVTTDKPK